MFAYRSSDLRMKLFGKTKLWLISPTDLATFVSFNIVVLSLIILETSVKKNTVLIIHVVQSTL